MRLLSSDSPSRRTSLLVLRPTLIRELLIHLNVLRSVPLDSTSEFGSGVALAESVARQTLHPFSVLLPFTVNFPRGTSAPA